MTPQRMGENVKNPGFLTGDEEAPDVKAAVVDKAVHYECTFLHAIKKRYTHSKSPLDDELNHVYYSTIPYHIAGDIRI